MYSDKMEKKTETNEILIKKGFESFRLNQFCILRFNDFSQTKVVSMSTLLVYII